MKIRDIHFYDALDLSLKENDILLVDGNDIKCEIDIFYSERDLFKPLTNIEFITYYKYFTKNWINIFSALQREYNPIDNYNMNSTLIESQQNDKITTTDINNNNTNISESTTYDNLEFVPYSKNTNTINHTYTTEHSNNLTYDDLPNSAFIGIHKENKSGNIGVTTSQQMLNSEYNLRKTQYIKIMVYKFVNSITYYEVNYNDNRYFNN